MGFGLAGFYAIFCLATISVAIEPGPVQLRLAKETALYGRLNGLALNVGTQLANIPTLLLVVFGLSYIVEAGTLVLDILRWLGIAYLVWGIVSLLRREPPLDGSDGAVEKGALPQKRSVRPIWKSMRTGYVMQMLNPAPWGFFAAFLPIWVRPELAMSTSLQLGSLAGALLAIFFLCDVVFVLTAAKMKSVLGNKRFAVKCLKWLGASWLGILACRLALDRH